MTRSAEIQYEIIANPSNIVEALKQTVGVLLSQTTISH